MVENDNGLKHSPSNHDSIKASCSRKTGCYKNWLTLTRLKLVALERLVASGFQIDKFLFLLIKATNQSAPADLFTSQEVECLIQFATA